MKNVHSPPRFPLSYYSCLIDHCFSLKSLNFGKIIHAQLIKVGFNSHTYLGNRSLDLYTELGSFGDALNAFNEIKDRNCISWNIWLKGLLRFGKLKSARQVFDEMTERDVVSWNSMISGYASYGFVDYALKLFSEMQNAGVKPNRYTYSILVPLVSCASHVKQIHGKMIRSSFNFTNVIMGNVLIDIYGKLGFVEYSFGVFCTMKEVDIISWNSLISVCYRSGFHELALDQFCLMSSTGHSPDEFTISTIMTVCSDLQDLDKGKQIFAFCIKVGFVSNSIVASATILLFSECNRLEDSVQLYDELGQLDWALCNSMISSYARHGSGHMCLQLFVVTFREDFSPTVYTLSILLSSISILLVPAEQGMQIHALVFKLGMESDAVVTSSLVEIYAKFGLIDSAMNVFAKMVDRDLISWNTMITGLARDGKTVETLDTFKELLREGHSPDRITLAGVLLACNYGGFVDKGMILFSSMKEKYGVTPGDEHYASIVDLLIRAGKFKEAVDIIETIPHEPSSVIWESMLHSSLILGNLVLTESIARRLMELEPHSSLPYLVLAKEYEMRARWESVVRVRKAMKEKGVEKVISCSLIGIKNHIFVFSANDLLPRGGREIHLILRLLIWEMEDLGYGQ